MNRERKNKVIIIIALIVSVIGMSIGFAVFSDTLTISSNAIVTPSEDDFKIVVYGLIDESEVESVIKNGNSPDLSKWSTTTAYQIKYDSGVQSFLNGQYNAVIDNNSNKLKISNIIGNFTGPMQGGLYYFVIKNEGAYDAYLNFSDEMLSYTGAVKSCTPGEGTTPELVQNVCESGIAPSGFVINPSGEQVEISFNGNYKIDVGDYVMFEFGIYYLNDVRADGPFTMEFIDYVFEFSSAPKE